MLNRYFIKLDYNGSAFHGWQIQPNAITVQEWINRALSMLLRENINVVGCGRTDTGVHARNFIAHFDSEIDNLQNNSQLIFKLNRFLPKEIIVHTIIKMHNDAHCRFDAVSRTYKYYITTQKSPFNYMFSLEHTRPLNLSKMQEAANILFDYSDFTSFSKIDTDTKTNNCKIMHAEWLQKEHELIFTIKADRFLRNMVRAIVGTLLQVGTEKIDINEFCKIVEVKDRQKAGASAPAHALFLEKVEYTYL